MKILRIIARLNVGGPARHVIWLTRELQGPDFQSSLIAGSVPEGEEDMSYLAAENHIEPVYIREMSRELSLRDVISLVKIYRRIKLEKPDIVHTHTAKAGTVGRVAAFAYRWLTLGTLIGRPRRLKIVHTFHGHVFHSYYGGAKTRVFLLIEKLLARLATDRIIVITDQQLNEIHGDFGVGRVGQFEIVPLGIDLGIFSGDASAGKTVRAEIGAADEEIVAGFVGRLTEIKDVPLLLDSIASYKSQRRTGSKPMKFAIIGDGHLRGELEKKARELNIDDALIFLGNRSDPGAFYPALDIVALTSRNEGTPLSLIEAMAAGRPVISTGVGGVVDLLGTVVEPMDGFSVCERGVRVDTRDPAHFAKGLIYLANNEQLMKRLSSVGRSYANAKYSKDRLVDDIRRVYRDLMERA